MGGTIKRLRKETGAVQIVEAAFVFPIMFIVLFFLIYMGNVFFIKARVDAIVVEKAISGANYCADPLLETIKQTGNVPALSTAKFQPYRYLFGGMGEIEAKIAQEVVDEMATKSFAFFKGMEPKLLTPKADIAKHHNYVVYSTFSVEIKYTITFPIRFFGSSEPIILTISSMADTPVVDAPEFIRNTDMVIDIFHGTKIGQAVSDVFSKMNEFLSNFANK